jgi:glycosidase
MLKKLSLFIWITVIFSCNKTPHKPQELMPPLTIERGAPTEIPIDEIFFAETYNPNFEKNNEIDIEFDSKNKLVKLTPADGASGLNFISFRNESKNNDLAVIIKEKERVTFSLRPNFKVKKLFVMGSFNTWNRNSHPLSDNDGDGIWTTTILLDEGIYQYQFVADKREFPDPYNDEKVDNGFGSFNSIKRVTAQNKKMKPAIFWEKSTPNKIRLNIESNRTYPINLYFMVDNKMVKTESISSPQYVMDISTLAPKHSSTLRIFSEANGVAGNTLQARIKNGKLYHSQQTEFWEDAIIYSLMVDRFNDGDSSNNRPIEHPELAKQANFNGGDLQGVIHKLQEGYFDKLGINTIWISPINKTTEKAFREWPEPHRYFTGYHGYWPVSATEVEPRFGNMKLFKKLVQLAHRNGIKVLIDFISNHTHIEHDFYKKHPSWFGKYELENGEKNIRRWDEYRLTTWFDQFLPSFDYLHSDSALNVMTDNAIWWLKESGVDGFRHDASKHVPYPFWKLLTRKIKTQINPYRKMDVYQIGETFGGDELIKSFVNPAMFDAQFNFNQFFTGRSVFVEKTGDFKDLAKVIDKSLQVYGYHHIMGNIMDSHDQTRMMGLLEGDVTLSGNSAERAWDKVPISVDSSTTYEKELLYLNYLLTTPGVPIIYYGDEIGMTGANDPDNRRMMRFGAELTDAEKRQQVQISKLIQLRRKYSSLRNGDWNLVYAAKNILVYTRGNSEERLLTAINKSHTTSKTELHLPPWLVNRTTTLLWGEGKISNLKNKTVLKLNGLKSAIWKLENHK